MCVVEVELVCSLSLGSIYMLTNVNALSDCLNNNSESSGVRCIATSNCSSKIEYYLLVGKSYCKLTVCVDSELIVVDSPCDGNFIIVLTNKRKLKDSILENVACNSKVTLLCSDLLFRSLLYELEVLEAIGAHGNEVRIAVIENKNTGCVSSPTKLSCMSLVYLGLSCARNIALLILYKSEGSGEVGNVGSYVRSIVSKSEVKILAGILLKLLSADSNALHSYNKTNVVLEICTGLNELGDVKNGNFLNSGINDGSGTALKLLHTRVRLNGRSNRNGHTNLDAEILNGILGKVVYVDTALALGISKEEVVVLVIERLGSHSNYDTFNGNGSALLCCHVILERDYIVLRNMTVEGNGTCCAIASLNGSSKLIVVSFCCLAVNVNGPRGLALCELNFCVVNGPVNCVRYVCNSNLSNYLVVIGSNNCTGLGGRSPLYVERSNILYSCSNIISDVVVFVVGVIAGEKIGKTGKLDLVKTGDLVTSYHNGKSKDKDENQR